ncbi:MAG: fumarylacetoacetate hydrolase family protein [Pseudomonadota bacterium]
MRVATINDGTPDGRLIVASREGTHYAIAPIATLQQALDDWAHWKPQLDAISRFDHPLDPALLRAPLPRAWQWLDGSTFPSHGELMAKAFGRAVERSEWPLMYQGLSDRFLSPNEDSEFPDESHGIDFEGEFGVITEAVPMGTDASSAASRIALIVQINDWSLRNLAGREMTTGFGWIQAKPACSMAPFAITPGELGPAWTNCRVALDLEVEWNGELFGRPNGAAMAFGFHELIAHAAATRHLPAGTVIGSGTVSNANYREVGSTCIAERRGLEMVDKGAASTSFMKYGDHVRMSAISSGGDRPFGSIDQRVVASRIKP